jgi:hypothetical protein
MTPSNRLWKILDKRRFLVAAMEELAGTAHISFEGDLSATRMSQLPEASKDETLVLKRNTLWPKQEFVVLPLEMGVVKTIISAIGGTIPASIDHIQIEKHGRLELGLYDGFHPKATFFGPAMSATFLDQLQAQGIMRPWIER